MHIGELPEETGFARRAIRDFDRVKLFKFFGRGGCCLCTRRGVCFLPLANCQNVSGFPRKEMIDFLCGGDAAVNGKPSTWR